MHIHSEDLGVQLNSMHVCLCLGLSVFIFILMSSPYFFEQRQLHNYSFPKSDISLAASLQYFNVSIYYK